MAKKKKIAKKSSEPREETQVVKEPYKYIRALRSGSELRWEYQLIGKIPTGMSHDQDISEYSDDDVIALTRGMLNVEDDDPVEIEVEYV